MALPGFSGDKVSHPGGRRWLALAAAHALGKIGPTSRNEEGEMSQNRSSHLTAIAVPCLALFIPQESDAVAQVGSTTAAVAVIEKPQARTATAGQCRVMDGTFGGTWGPAQLPLLAFTIGPKSAMADLMHADKRRFDGPGVYKNVVIAVYLGKTALEDVHAGLGTVTVNADGHSGKFTLNDGSTAGRWACGSLTN
jgi:hypothetical protein